MKGGFDNAPSAKDAYNIPYASTSTAEDKVVKKPRKAKVDAEKNSFGGRQDLGGVSKSVYRILNAGAVREEFQNNKRKREEDEKAAIAKKGVKVS